MGEPESEEAHQERASTRELSVLHAPAAEDIGDDDQPQQDRHHDKQGEHKEANEGPPVCVHTAPTGSTDSFTEESVVFAESGQHTSADTQHASRGSAPMHVIDGTLESSALSAEATCDETAPTETDTQEQACSPTTQLTAAASSASSHTAFQPASEETEQQSHSMPGQYHQLSYNGGSAEADKTPHTAATLDQLSGQPGAISETAGSKQTEQPAEWASPSVPKEQDVFQQDEGAREEGRLDEPTTSDLAGTGIAGNAGMKPMRDDLTVSQANCVEGAASQELPLLHTSSRHIAGRKLAVLH